MIGENSSVPIIASRVRAEEPHLDSAIAARNDGRLINLNSASKLKYTVKAGYVLRGLAISLAFETTI